MSLGESVGESLGCNGSYIYVVSFLLLSDLNSLPVDFWL